MVEMREKTCYQTLFKYACFLWLFLFVCLIKEHIKKLTVQSANLRLGTPPHHLVYHLHTKKVTDQQSGGKGKKDEEKWKKLAVLRNIVWVEAP